MAHMTSEYTDIDLPGGAVLQIRRNHEDSELTVGVRNSCHSRQARITVTPSHGIAVGGSLTLEDAAEEPVRVAFYLGPITVYFGARGYWGRSETPPPPPGGWPVDEKTGYVTRPPPVMVDPPGLLRRAVAALVGNLQRRKTSAVVASYDDGMVEGVNTVARVCLWDDDSQWTAGKSRQYSLNLTHAVWGKPTQTDDIVIEERRVEVALPEGKYAMRAKLRERKISWARWPLVKLYRSVSFSPACMLVPQRKSDSLSFEGNRAGCTSIVEAGSIRAGVAALISRVLRDREAYGRVNWTPKPTALWRESHNLGLEPVERGADRIVDRLLHGETLWLLPRNDGPPRLVKPDYQPNALMVGFSRHPIDGGVVVHRFPATSPLVIVDGEPVGQLARVWPESRVSIGGHEFTAWYSPVGPAPEAVQLQLVDPDPGDVAGAAERDVAEVAATLDTSTPAPDEVDPPGADLFGELQPGNDPPDPAPEQADPPPKRWEGD